jgi:hydroxyacylglutathione hydrolase
MNIICFDRLINKPINSNCYVLSSNFECIIIDPGYQNSNGLINYIIKNSLSIKYVLLTHEHFDHIYSVNSLREKFDFKIVCSKICSDNIGNNKKNLSVFYDQKGFEVDKADILIEDLNYNLQWANSDIIFFETKGHSKGSISIEINDLLFTGDVLIKDIKTVTKLPGGDKTEVIKTFNFFNSRYKQKKITICPGHGEIFLFDDIDLKDYT